jgi:aminomethyltransferase
VDDCVIYRTGPNAFMVVFGAGNGYEMLVRAVEGRQVSVLFDDDMHDISLQGPNAIEFLADHVPGIRDLPYFHHIQTRLFDRPVMISRTGYTGERGYEIFCKANDVVEIWDQILELGKPLGIIPCAFTTLDMLRVESSLLFYPYDNSEMYPFENEAAGDTLWELGLTFTVSKGKTEFRGATEYFRLKGKERFKIYGALLEGDQAAKEGDTLWADGKQVGVITCAMYSKLTQKSMALVRFDPAYAVQGSQLEVKGSLNVSAIAHSLPFDDPDKKKRTAKG